MRTIGRKFRNLVKKETIGTMRERDRRGWGYQGIVKEVRDRLPVELWDTWEGADGEINRIIEDTIQEN